MSSSPARRALAAGFGAATLTAALVAGATSAGAAPAKPTPTAPVPLQLLALNDFHGQLEPPTGSGSRLPGFPTTRVNDPAVLEEVIDEAAAIGSAGRTEAGR